MHATATTGLAACHVKGTTLQQFAGMGKAKGSGVEVIKAVRKRPDAVRRWRATQVGTGVARVGAGAVEGAHEKTCAVVARPLTSPSYNAGTESVGFSLAGLGFTRITLATTVITDCSCVSTPARFCHGGILAFRETKCAGVCSSGCDYTISPCTVQKCDCREHV